MHGSTGQPSPVPPSRRAIQRRAQVDSNFFLQSIFSKRCALACVLCAHFSKLTRSRLSSKSLDRTALRLHSTVAAETCGGVEISRLLICFQSDPPSLPLSLPSPPLSLPALPGELGHLPHQMGRANSIQQL